METDNNTQQVSKEISEEEEDKTERAIEKKERQFIHCKVTPFFIAMTQHRRIWIGLRILISVRCVLWII